MDCRGSHAKQSRAQHQRRVASGMFYDWNGEYQWHDFWNLLERCGLSRNRRGKVVLQICQEVIFDHRHMYGTNSLGCGNGSLLEMPGVQKHQLRNYHLLQALCKHKARQSSNCSYQSEHIKELEQTAHPTQANFACGFPYSSFTALIQRGTAWSENAVCLLFQAS